MKRIELGKGYAIDIDSHNFTLKSNIKEIIKDGETAESCTTHGYFGSLENAIKDMLKQRITDKIDGTISLSELRNIILDTQKEIRDITSQLGL